MSTGRIVLALSGASGAPYARAAIEALTAAGRRVLLIASPVARQVWQEELGEAFNAWLESLPAEKRALIELQNHQDVGAGCASGSFRHDGMLVIPCSAKTLAGIAHGYASNLTERAADVCLKERRRLVLVFRETPISLIHIDNMRAVTLAGGIVLPASPGFYHGDTSYQGLVNFVAGKALDLLDVPHDLFTRWKDPADRGD